MTIKKTQRIVVGLSGGVDSAVAALMLKDRGFDVIGCFMKNWEEDDTASRCGAEEDYKMARAVCEQLRIPLQAVNFASEYWERVFSRFLGEYRGGRTPNPDVLCNQEIKFNVFLDHALSLGADLIATGHYARVRPEEGRQRLFKARDLNKDQTYFLHRLSQQQLGRVLFPLDDMRKPEVRARARAAGLPNHERPDSTGICFIGERNFKTFLARYLPAEPGEIRAVSGEYKGSHDGLMYYTIGQRHGLGVGGPGAPWYVVGKNLASRTLWVAQGERHPALFSDSLDTESVHWIGDMGADTAQLCAKTRYRQTDQACRLTDLGDNRWRVHFHEPQRALTPGQSVVFYRNDECLGGAVIDRVMAPDLNRSPQVNKIPLESLS